MKNEECRNNSEAAKTLRKEQKRVWARNKFASLSEEQKERIREKDRLRYQANKEQRRLAAKAYRDNNLDRVRERENEYNRKNKPIRRAYKLKYYFGLSVEAYTSLFQKQNNGCAICSTNMPLGRGAFHVDHDHKTGKIRGLLCHHCNLALGHFRDSIEFIDVAINYLNSGYCYVPSQKLSDRFLTRKEFNKNQNLKKTYGLTIVDYEILLLEQTGQCKICLAGGPGPKEALCVDHEHSTGRIRGLLCRNCNLGIGHFRDSPAIMERARSYLRGITT